MIAIATAREKFRKRAKNKKYLGKITRNGTSARIWMMMMMMMIWSVICVGNL